MKNNDKCNKEGRILSNRSPKSSLDPRQEDRRIGPQMFIFDLDFPLGILTLTLQETF